MNIPDSLKKAREDFNAARVALAEAERTWEIEDKLPATQEMIGKCFRYRNRYSNSEQWWLYIKIYAVEEGSFLSVRVQKDCNGMVSVEDRHYDDHDHFLNNSYTPITQGEFGKEAGAIMAELLSRVIQ